MAALGLCCCARAFSSCGERGPLFVAVRGLLIAVASLVAERGHLDFYYSKCLKSQFCKDTTSSKGDLILQLWIVSGWYSGPWNNPGVWCWPPPPHPHPYSVENLCITVQLALHVWFCVGIFNQPWVTQYCNTYLLKKICCKWTGAVQTRAVQGATVVPALLDRYRILLCSLKFKISLGALTSWVLCSGIFGNLGYKKPSPTYCLIAILVIVVVLS